jgi:hypothetical protein
VVVDAIALPLRDPDRHQVNNITATATMIAAMKISASSVRMRHIARRLYVDGLPTGFVPPERSPERSRPCMA